MAPLRNFLIFILLSLILLSLFYFTPAPPSWVETQTWQIILIFTLILFIPTFFVNIFLNYIPRSFCIGLGVLMASLQLALNQKSPIIYSLIALLTILLFFFIPKKSLTRTPKIPKMAFGRKQKRHPEEPLRRRGISRLRRARLS